MVFDWLRRRRRRKLNRQPFPATWEQHIEQNCAFYQLLDADERLRLKQRIQVVVAEKYWEGCQDLEITDEITITIAAQASLLLLGFEDHYFDRLKTILVYPERYVAKNTTHQSGGVVSESMDVRLGEAWHGGPVILSWSSVLAGGRRCDDGHNVVLHEFAHVLDMQGGGVDGTPPLQSREQYQTWHKVMTAEYQQLVRHSAGRRATLLDHYGATDEAEFFAVSTECFFEQPAAMLDKHPELYELFREFYCQDPAQRMGRPAAAN